MVVYLRMVSEEQLADEREEARFQELWEENHGDREPPAPWRSLPIRVWTMLRQGPLTAAEIAEELRVSRDSVHYAITALRKHGQDVFCPSIWRERGRPRKYHLIPSGPLRMVAGPQGLCLAPPDGDLKPHQVVIEVE